MSFNPTKVTHEFSSAPQIEIEDIAKIAAQGYKTILNCRPDGEGGRDQPSSAELKAATERFGLQYYHFPIVMGMDITTQAQMAAAALASAPTPVLGFCKSGMRANNLYLAATGKSGEMTLFQWLKSKCLITRFWRWCRNKRCATQCCK